MWTEDAEEIADASPGCLNGSLVGLAQQGLQLGEHHFDWIEVGAVGGKKEQLGPDGTDRVTRGPALMAAEVVGDHDVARVEGGGQELGDPGGKGNAVDRPVDHAGRDHAIMAQASKEGERLAMSVRNLGDQRAAAQAPATRAGHVGFHPVDLLRSPTIDEDETPRVKTRLVTSPARPEANQLRAVRLAGKQRFF